MIANYRIQAELSSIETTEDGKSVVVGTVDGCLTVLAIADPGKPEMKEYLQALPSRNEEVRSLFVDDQADDEAAHEMSGGGGLLHDKKQPRRDLEEELLNEENKAEMRRKAAADKSKIEQNGISE